MDESPPIQNLFWHWRGGDAYAPKKDFDVQCTAQVGCTHTKKEDPSSEESSFEISITFGLFIATPNIVEIAHKAIALIIYFIIAHLRYKFK